VRGLLTAAARGGPAGRLAAQALRGFNRMRRPVAAAQLDGLDGYFSFYAGLPQQLRARPRIRCGIYVHDLIPFLMPEHCSDKQRAVLSRILRSIRPTDLVAVNSDCTRRDLAQWLDREPETICVVPLAADPAVFRRDTDPAAMARLRARYALPDDPYALSLHSGAPHKNMPMLIRAHAAYRRRSGTAALPLVIAGGKGDPRAEIAAAGGLSPNDLDGVTFLGFVDDADLAPLYSGARAFFFPSRYEGFGLPVLEALFCGVPVFAADRASLPEIFARLSGPHAGADRLLPVDDTDAWADAFARAETLAPLDNAAIAEVRAHFSWTRSAAGLLALLRGGPGPAQEHST
jgi:glycosyltransferase involved in cell wall biosynthesis